MLTYHLVGAYRVAVATPKAHTHIIAIGTVELSAGDFVPTKAWTARDLEEANPQPEFVVGPVGVMVPASVSVTQCPECGEQVVRVFPAELEASLPECRVG